MRVLPTCQSAVDLDTDQERRNTLNAHVADGLEEQGLASFAKSWDELIASVTSQLEKAGAEVMPAGAVKPISEDDQTHGAAPASAAPRQTAAE